ncbi:hypothetical protein Bca4012_037679 [Brassica carinata]
MVVVSPPTPYQKKHGSSREDKGLANQDSRDSRLVLCFFYGDFCPIEEFLQSLSRSSVHSVQTISSKPFFSFGDQVEVLLRFVQISRSFEADTLPGSPDIFQKLEEVLSEF